MQRYFIPNENFDEQKVTIKGEDARHIIKVMRMMPDDQIIVCNENQEAFICEIKEHTESGDVQASIISTLEANTELPVKVTIVQGLLKGDKMDWVVQKATELGAVSFVPFNAKRSIVKWEGSSKVERRIQRLEKIAKEAAEQSHRLQVPTIEDPLALRDLIGLSEQFDYCLVAYEEEAKQGKQGGLPSLLEQMPSGASVLAVIGPEGGLEQSEIDALTDSGFQVCGLGRRILRAETAPMYLMSALSYYYELQKR